MKKYQGIYRDISSEEYHGAPGTFSSSQLKTMLDDEEQFFRKYIAKTEDKETSTVFDIGTYFHTAILEPEKLTTECAVFKGIRRGAAWERFQEENKGKAIITENELKQAENLIDGVKNSPCAMAKIASGEPEVSCFVDVVVSKGFIFVENKILGKYGWEPINGIVPNVKEAVTIPLKVRADCLGDDFILDLKSTSGNTKKERAMRDTISKYSYDLSAALYLDIFSIGLKKPMENFIWTFASKDVYLNSKSYYADIQNIQIGRAKWSKAVVKLASFLREGWQFEDSYGILKPNVWELEHIKPRDEDLL